MAKMAAFKIMDCALLTRMSGLPPAVVNLDVLKMAVGYQGPSAGRPADYLEPGWEKAAAEIGDLAESEEDIMSYACFPREAREFLRPQFLSSDMGVSGGILLIAETGSVAPFTNEGNEGMCTIVPRVHVVVTGIEKVVPTLDDLAALMPYLNEHLAEAGRTDPIDIMFMCFDGGAPEDKAFNVQQHLDALLSLIHISEPTRPY